MRRAKITERSYVVEWSEQRGYNRRRITLSDRRRAVEIYNDHAKGKASWPNVALFKVEVRQTVERLKGKT